MASISTYDVTYNSAKLKLTNLSTSEIEYDRLVLWYIDGTLVGTASLERNVSEGGDITVRDLAPDTIYSVDCRVRRTDTGEVIWSSENYEFITADIPSFYITSLGAEQTALGEKSATVAWNGYNMVGGTYSIKVWSGGALYTKASGDIISSSMSVQIAFDNFGTYEVWLVVEKYGTSVTETVNVEIADSATENPVDPVISFTIKQSSLYPGNHRYAEINIYASCDMSDVNFYIYDKTTSTSYTLTISGWSEDSLDGSSCYSAYTTFGMVDESGTHEFELNYTYVVNIVKTITVTFQEPYDFTISNLRYSYGYRSVTFECDPVPETRTKANYRVQYKSGDNYVGWISAYNSNIVTASSQPFGRTYDIRMFAGDGTYTVYANALTATVTIPPAPPTISLEAKDGAIELTYGVTDSTYIDSFLFNLYDGNGTLIGSQSVTVNSTDSISPTGTITFSDLESGTYYVCGCTYRNDVQCFVSADSADRLVRSNSVDVTNSAKNVEPWDWEVGESTDRDKAYQALTGQGEVSAFRYTVWNEICEKVLEALEAVDSTWDIEFASYDSTKMTDTTTGRTLTSARFNSLRKNVGNRASTGIEKKEAGNPVSGSEFITITDALNNWIGTIN